MHYDEKCVFAYKLNYNLVLQIRHFVPLKDVNITQEGEQHFTALKQLFLRRGMKTSCGFTRLFFY